MEPHKFKWISLSITALPINNYTPNIFLEKFIFFFGGELNNGPDKELFFTIRILEFLDYIICLQAFFHEM